MNLLYKYFNSNDKKTLFSNFLSLSVLQCANYILPLLTVPYLLRTIGLAKFGIISFAQAIIQYLLIFTDFGLSTTAPRDITLNRESNVKLNEIFSIVMIIRVTLTFLSFWILFLCVSFIPRLQDDKFIFLFSYGIVAGEVLFPIWFFQGIEKMKYITILNIISKVIFTLAIFIFIKSENDYIYVPVFYSLGYLTSGFLSLYIIFHNFGIKLVLPLWPAIINTFKSNFLFFLSRLSASIYPSTNTFFLGLFTTNEITGFYATADKIVRAATSLNYPLANVLYPYISRTKNTGLFKKIFYSWNFIAISIFISFLLFHSTIIGIVSGEQNTLLSNTFLLYSLQIPIIFPSMLLGLPFLIALGHPKYVNFSFIFSSVFHLICMCLLIPVINIYYTVMLTFITELFVLLTRIYAIKKHKLWN